MRRNAVSAGLITLLLSVASVASIVPSVANDAGAATAHTAAHTASAAPARALRVASALKRRRVALAAAVAVPPPAPAAPAYLPAVDQPTITENHKKIATAVLNALPAGCRDNLKNFSVLYKGATRRGLGGKTTIILDGSVPDGEFAALLVHECGHVIGANLAGSATSGDSGYRDGAQVFYKDSPMVAYWSLGWTATGARKAGLKDGDYASGYAKSDQYEDFAETFALYALQRDEFLERAKTSAIMASKLDWMDKHLPLAAGTVGVGSDAGTGTVPWDVTKLAFLLSR
jgi:hypothetical protein